MKLLKLLTGVLGLAAIIMFGGCAVEAYPPGAGVSVGVYGEYPYTYYGGGYYHHHYYRHHGRWYHPYDRDRYFYRY